MARKHDVVRGNGFIEERTTKAGALRFVARFHDGVTWRGKTFASIEEAEDHLRMVGRAKRSGRYVPDDEMTIADLLDDYLRHGADRWSANTLALYTASVEKIIVPRIGRVLLREMTTRRAQTFADGLKRDYGPPSIARVRAILSGAFRDAHRAGTVTANPISGIRTPTPKRKDKQVWTQDEVARVLAHVAHDPMASAWYHLALTTGIRPGEERALRWSDIDLSRRIVTIRRTATRDYERRQMISDTTKTGKDRVVSIPEETVMALKAWRPVLTARRLKAAHWRDLDLVFPSRNGNLSPQQSWDKRHTRTCEEAGVTPISPHGTRHTYATLALEAGVDYKTVTANLGHSSTAFTMDVYVKVTDAMQRAAADTIGALLKRRV